MFIFLGVNPEIMRSSHLSQCPAVSKRLCIIDFDVTGGGHVVHCHTVEVSTKSTEESLVGGQRDGRQVHTSFANYLTGECDAPVQTFH